MSNMLRLMIMLLLLTSPPPVAAKDYRQDPCEAAANLACLHIHGRLASGNGTPSTRLWHIGTRHIYGIYSNWYGFLHDDETLDNESPELHFTLPKDIPRPGGFTVYGDFDLCPLEPLMRGHMQAACIASATHIVEAQ